ncbi:MAG: hypothetical protein ABS951_03725 [Solibacillus sp.]
MKKIFDTVICGAGPAGMSQFIYQDSIGHLNQFLDMGVCVLEKKETLLSGNLSNYNISANSKGSALFEFLTDQSTIKQFLNEQSSMDKIEKMYDVAPNLMEVGKIYEEIGRFLKQEIVQHPLSEVITGAVIEGIEVQADNSYKVVYVKQHERFEVFAKNIHVNLGGVSKSINVHNDSSFTLAHEVISDKATKNMEIFKQNTPKNIALIGNSHSAMSVLNKLNQDYAIFNDEKVKIDIYGQSPVKLYYASTSEADADGYVYGEDDICFQTNRVNRYSGMREESFEIAKAILNDEIKNINLTNCYFENQEKYDVIIECLGYETRMIPFTKMGQSILFKMNQGVLCTDEYFRPLLIDNQPLKNCHAYGIGVGLILTPESGGEKSFNRNIDGVWLYQHFVAKKLVDMVVYQ